MKFLIKLAIIAFAAKVMIASPRGANKQLDRVGDMTVRQVAHEVDSALQTLQKKLSHILS